MSLEETQAFFEAYRDAFNRFDGQAVADLWHTPCGITDSGAADGTARLTWWPDDAPKRANHIALCDVYRGQDDGSADFDLEQHLPMGPNHAFAHLHWTLKRSNGSLLQRFHTGYQLLRTAQGLRVLLAVAHQENLSEMKRHAAE